MSNADASQKLRLFDTYLEALAAHTVALAELRATEDRHQQDNVDSVSALAERLMLKQVEQAAYVRYRDAKMAYEHH